MIKIFSGGSFPIGALETVLSVSPASSGEGEKGLGFADEIKKKDSILYFYHWCYRI
jgi:hypothetical protein